jgi:hypothetical protein
MTIMERAKTALRLTTDDEALTAEIQGYIDDAYRDLTHGGYSGAEELAEDPEVVTAVLMYVRLHFGQLADGEYDRMKRAYDEKKAQIGMSTGLTNWGVDDG